MAGLDPATQWPRVGAAAKLIKRRKSSTVMEVCLQRALTCAHWVAGSSPAMTNKGASAQIKLIRILSRETKQPVHAASAAASISSMK